MRRLRGAAAACALLVAGCGSGGGGSTATVGAAPPPATATTRVDVLKSLPSGASSGRFDPETIYARESPGVVTVISTGLRGAHGDEAGLGSGFVLSGDGEVVTNAHVVTSGQGAKIAPATGVLVRFHDGNEVSAKVLGFDPFADVALLRVDPRGLRLRPLPLASAGETVRAGAPVAAIGSPFGEEQSLSVGVVSAVNRDIDSLTSFSTTGAIQTDAAINHGNSGGPLLDARGRVLGINSQIQSSDGQGSGVGFAIPIAAVRKSLGMLRAHGAVSYAYLGLATQALYPQVARAFHLPVDKGVWVQQLTAGGPAAKAGVRASGPRRVFQHQPWQTGGDVITAVDGTPTDDDGDLSSALAGRSPGDVVTLHVIRAGHRREVRVRLGKRPLQAAAKQP